MLINLRAAASTIPQQLQVELTERLPAHVLPPCQLQCEYRVEQLDDYFLVTMAIHGQITMVCQRCMHEYPHVYDNTTVIAACSTEEKAEQLMAAYECVLMKKNQIDFIELITDDLHLYSPQHHLDPKDCDESVGDYLTF